MCEWCGVGDRYLELWGGEGRELEGWGGEGRGWAKMLGSRSESWSMPFVCVYMCVCAGMGGFSSFLLQKLVVRKDGGKGGGGCNGILMRDDVLRANREIRAGGLVVRTLNPF